MRSLLKGSGMRAKNSFENINCIRGVYPERDAIIANYATITSLSSSRAAVSLVRSASSSFIRSREISLAFLSLLNARRGCFANSMSMQKLGWEERSARDPRSYDPPSRREGCSRRSPHRGWKHRRKMQNSPSGFLPAVLDLGGKR